MDLVLARVGDMYIQSCFASFLWDNLGVDIALGACTAIYEVIH